MRSGFSMLLGGCIVAQGLFLASADRAYAVATFSKEFVAKYVDKESDKPHEKALAEAVAKVKCNVCHEGKKKKDLNVYGAALGELLDKKADAKNVEKIQAALEQVGAMKSDPEDANSPTFDELFRQGKLPGEQP